MRFWQRWRTVAAGGEAVLALIDDGAFAARWSGEPARVADRRAAWQRIC